MTLGMIPLTIDKNDIFLELYPRILVWKIDHLLSVLSKLTYFFLQEFLLLRLVFFFFTFADLLDKIPVLSPTEAPLYLAAPPKLTLAPACGLLGEPGRPWYPLAEPGPGTSRNDWAGGEVARLRSGGQLCRASFESGNVVFGLGGRLARAGDSHFLIFALPGPGLFNKALTSTWSR